MTEAIEILQRQREWCKSRGKTLEAHHIHKMIQKLRKEMKHVQG